MLPQYDEIKYSKSKQFIEEKDKCKFYSKTKKFTNAYKRELHYLHKLRIILMLEAHLWFIQHEIFI
jgi:hypothetical protein